MPRFVATREVPCQSPRAALWLALADTNRLNRAAGNYPLVVEAVDRGVARYLVRTRLAGLRVAYEELPFEWHRPDLLSITRIFRNGPARRYSFELTLSPQAAGGTRVGVRLEVEPRWIWTLPFVQVNTWLFARKLVKVIRTIDRGIQAGEDGYAGLSASPVDKAALARARQTLLLKLESAGRRNQAAMAEHLVELVAAAPDALVHRMRPFELADEWRAERRQTLALCLQAVMAGLLDLTWDVVCPSCRTVTVRQMSLSDLQTQAHCHFCDITVNVELERAVEATFRPTPAIRRLDERPFCIGGPFRTPHVITQAHLDAGGAVELQAPMEEGRYRLFIRGGAVVSLDVAADGQDEVRITAGEQAQPLTVRVPPGGNIVVRDELMKPRHVKLEHLAWASDAATAQDVSTLSDFRRLFSAEVLRPGRKVKVTRVALLFTDLAGSTSLYTEYGDAVAYRFVQEHFTVLNHIVGGHSGAVVKTIGDSVMAAFADERAAVATAIDMQRYFRWFAADRQGARADQLRVGVCAGACYLVNANNRLDYFGQVVNVANRLQSTALGGQIVIPAEIADHGIEQGWLCGVHIAERFAARLKGLDQPLPAVRLEVEGVEATDIREIVPELDR